MTSTIACQIDANAAASPGDVWLTSPDTAQTLAWHEVAHRARDIACHLDALDLPLGAPVAVAAQNSIGSCLTFAGITYGGYLATPLNLVAGVKVLSYVINHSGVTIILVSDDYRALIEQAVSGVDRAITLIPLDTAAGPLWPTDTQPETLPRHVPTAETAGLLMYTSGTTGNPKGVILTHKNLIAAGNNVVIGHDITAADTGMCVLPIYHINGLCVTVMGTLVSASGLVMPYRFSVSGFWRQVKANKVSWFSAVPTLFAYLLNDETPVTPVTIDRDRLRFAGLHRRHYPRKSTVNLKKNLASRSLKRWALLKRVPRFSRTRCRPPSQDRFPRCCCWQ